MRSRRVSLMAGGGTPAGAGVDLRAAQRRTRKAVPRVAKTKRAMGMAQATLSKPPRMGAARTVAPYLPTNQLRTRASAPRPLGREGCGPGAVGAGELVLQLADHAGGVRAADVVALQQDLGAAADAHHVVTDA